MHPMPTRRRFSQVDVFTAEALRGNALAVVVDAEGLDDRRMAAFARWTNLSETTFLLPPSNPAADYRVRIFTPGGELPFAGHPTLGSCRVWLATGGRPRRDGVVVQECAIGLVPIRTGERLAFKAPPTAVEPADPLLLGRLQAALGLPDDAVRDAAWLTNGPRQLALWLDDADRVTSLRPDLGALRALAPGLTQVGVAGPDAAGPDHPLQVRFFAPALGVDEDPVTGSFHANLAHWLIDSGRLPRSYVAGQGAALGRDGRVHVARDGEGTWIGGDVADCVDGVVLL